MKNWKQIRVMGRAVKVREDDHAVLVARGAFLSMSVSEVVVTTLCEYRRVSRAVFVMQCRRKPLTAHDLAVVSGMVRGIQLIEVLR